jgi:TolA-binding protein
MVLVLAVLLCAFPQQGRADNDPLPMPPRLYDDDGEGFSPAEFERMLQKLRTEREALHSDWQALLKRNVAPAPSLETEQRQLEQQIQKALEILRKNRAISASYVLSQPESPKKKPEPEAKPPETKKTSKGDAPTPGTAEKSSAAVDILAQAHTLVRSKQYEEALTAFQQVDLKGKKANERAPIQYLKACCLLHLGKSADASELFQEVANNRGDEKLAGYAQWQLETLRWQRDLAQRLQDIRQRYQALEKAP